MLRKMLIIYKVLKKASCCYITVVIVKFLLLVVVIFAARGTLPVTTTVSFTRVAGLPAGRYKYGPLVSAGDWYQDPR